MRSFHVYRGTQDRLIDQVSPDLATDAVWSHGFTRFVIRPDRLVCLIQADDAVDGNDGDGGNFCIGVSC